MRLGFGYGVCIWAEFRSGSGSVRVWVRVQFRVWSRVRVRFRVR